MDNSIGHVTTDYEGNLWFTSSRQGVMKIVPNQFADIFERYNIPEDVEDGYLTAQEISELALNHTQLVVLSACNTGLGQVGDNGVYGLERAFKLAGAKTIIMTLGAVDDSATSLFMRRFYKYLFDGNSPREALHKTQSFLRDGNQYNEPFYWAAFVIVD